MVDELSRAETRSGTVTLQLRNRESARDGCDPFAWRLYADKSEQAGV